MAVRQCSVINLSGGVIISNNLLWFEILLQIHFPKLASMATKVPLDSVTSWLGQFVERVP